MIGFPEESSPHSQFSDFLDQSNHSKRLKGTPQNIPHLARSLRCSLHKQAQQEGYLEKVSTIDFWSEYALC